MTLGYDPDRDIPDLTGKVFLITGGAYSLSTTLRYATDSSPSGTAGLGKETISQLAKHSPKHIYFTGRNKQAAEAVISEIKTTSPNITFIPCDQTSLGSVSQAAKTFLEKSGNQLDVLICNAAERFKRRL